MWPGVWNGHKGFLTSHGEKWLNPAVLIFCQCNSDKQAATLRKSCPNTGKYGPEKLSIWTLFTQWI